MQNRKVLVLGTGKSGICAARQILSLGGHVVLYDSNKELDKLKVLKNFNKKDKITVIVGDLNMSDLIQVDLAVISPGIPLDKPFVKLIQAAGLKGFSIGQAAVSMKHANFITTTKGVTSEDYRSLVSHVQRVVFEQFGVLLEPEIELLGFGVK